MECKEAGIRSFILFNLLHVAKVDLKLAIYLVTLSPRDGQHGMKQTLQTQARSLFPLLETGCHTVTQTGLKLTAIPLPHLSSYNPCHTCPGLGVSE